MTDLSLANKVLVDIKNKDIISAKKNIETLLDQKIPLGEHWGAITRLALSIGEIDLSIKSAQHFLELSPSQPKRILQVAGIYAEAGKINEAIELVKPISNIEKSASLCHFLGTTYSQIGKLKEAQFYLEKSISLAPQVGISWLTLSAIKKMTDKDLALFQQIEPQIKGNDQQNQIPFWFAFGKALLDTNQPNEAFKKFSIGCQLMHTKYSFNHDDYDRYIESIIKSQNQAYFNSLPKFQSSHTERIIFIIGLPRSGTTLLQQILTSHSKIKGGGETNCMTIALSTLGHANLLKLPELDSASQKEKLQKIHSDYKHLIEQKLGASNFVVDKTLNLNHQLGVIKNIFPHASIIKINRDAKDNAWSCFRTFFNNGLHWSYNFEDIQKYFSSESKLFSHWKTLFSDDILEIDYEDLVQNPEDSIKSCTDHIGLPFEHELLEFYKSNNPVQTASVGQVRAPLNVQSIGVPEAIKEHLNQINSTNGIRV